MELCFNRIRPELRMPERTCTSRPLIWRSTGELGPGALPGDAGRTGRGQALGVQRSAAARGALRPPPSPEEYRKLETRIVELHPMTLIQNARTSGGGVVQNVPSQALTVGPVETWKAEKVRSGTRATTTTRSACG